MAHRAVGGRQHSPTPSAADGVQELPAGVRERDLMEPLSFEDLFISENRRLFGTLCLITGDPNEAEDVGQEAFVRVLERWDRVASMIDPVGYLYRVAINVFRSRYRRARVAARRFLVAQELDRIAEVDERDVVTRMLGGLSPRQRAALVLTTVLDYSSEETGEILGLPASSVRVLTTRARATLRAQTGEDR
jgi:RNA polymerase sigma-70 factor (ECF subfamily)